VQHADVKLLAILDPMPTVAIAVKATALLLGSITVSVTRLGAPPARADSSDDVFIAALQDAGFPSVNRSTITALGRSICDQLHNGVGFSKIATIAMDSGFTPGQGGT